MGLGSALGLEEKPRHRTVLDSAEGSDDAWEKSCQGIMHPHQTKVKASAGHAPAVSLEQRRRNYDEKWVLGNVSIAKGKVRA